MKKTLLASALFALVSVNASASPKISFQSGDDLPETKLCIAVAEDGLNSAKKLAKNMGVNFKEFRSDTTCNKLSVFRFAKKYKAVEEVATFEEVMKKNALFQIAQGAIDTDASAHCVNAAQGKLITNTRVTCNGINITKFAKKVSKKYNVLVTNI